MPPLILHNVPDEELYIGEDGVQRPYAMVFPGTETYNTTSRARRNIPETGSFGKSTRRSRSKTGTPAKREDPNILVADAIFSTYISELAAKKPVPAKRGSLPPSSSQPNLASQTSLIPLEDNVPATNHYFHKEPTEVVLRGFSSQLQYAALNHYEAIAGRICEDYSRDPPVSQRRFKSDLRDQASLRSKPLTPEEKAKALRFAGGENWIKITFESHEAAESAVYASPQTILGYQVYAEFYHGRPPSNTEALPVALEVEDAKRRPSRAAFSSATVGATSGAALGRGDARGRQPSIAQTQTLPRSFTAPSIGAYRIPSPSLSASIDSNTTLSAGTLDEVHTLSTSATIASTPTQTPPRTPPAPPPSIYCSKIPTAKKLKLLPATEALLPQKSFSQMLFSHIPVVGWLSSDIIGSEVPRDENGEFEWLRASFYWRLVWWLDFWFKLFGGDVVGGKEE